MPRAVRRRRTPDVRARLPGLPADEPGPRLPGGGPAGWSPSQYPASWSRRIVLGLLLVGAGFAAAGLVVGRGPVSPLAAENATALLTFAGWLVPAGVAGWCIFFPAWRSSRVADDVRTYAVGMPCATWREYPGRILVVEVDGRRYEGGRSAPRERPEVEVDGRRHHLVLDRDEHTAPARRRESARWLRGDGAVRGTAAGEVRDPWTDWTIEVDGRTLRVRAPSSGGAPHRATLLDDLGRAWLLRQQPLLRLEARLPEDLTDAGAVFVMWCADELVRDSRPLRLPRDDPGRARRA